MKEMAPEMSTFEDIPVEPETSVIQGTEQKWKKKVPSRKLLKFVFLSCS